MLRQRLYAGVPPGGLFGDDGRFLFFGLTVHFQSMRELEVRLVTCLTDAALD